MKANNQEKSPYANFSFDASYASGEKVKKEPFTGKTFTDGDLRIREADKKCSTKNS